MEETSSVKKVFIITLSFLVGMILEVLPLPHWAVWSRPEWVFLVLFFWVLSQPQYVGVFVAFFVGLLVDLLTGTLLGQHAFVYTFMVYLIITFYSQLKTFPLWQQLVAVFMFMLLRLALQCWILEIMGTLPRNWGYWLPAITSTVVWLWFYVLLKDRHESIRGFG